MIHYWPNSTKKNDVNKDDNYSHLEILPSEQLNAHDGKDEPEDETHEQHVEDGRYRLH